MRSDMVRCNVCGEMNRPANQYCKKCGNPLAASENGVANPSNTNVPALQDQEIHQPGDYQPHKPPVTKPRRLSTTKTVLSKGFVIGGGAFTVVLCAFVTVLVYTAVVNRPSSPGHGSPSSPDSSNPSSDFNSNPTGEIPGGLIEMTVTPELFTYEGLWIQNYGQPTQSGGMAIGAATFLFRDGRVYAGNYGETADEIFLGLSGSGIPGGSPFELTPDSVIMYDPNGNPYTYRRDGTSWWMGDSIFTPDPGSEGGRIVPKN